MKKIVLRKCLVTVVLIFTFAAFAQNQVTLPLEAFYAKVKNQKKPQLIDSRSSEEFAQNHIEGALNFNQDSENYPQFIAALDKKQPVFIYSIGAGRSVVLANNLVQKGFTEVYTLEGGIAAWIGGGKAFYTNLKSKLTLADYRKIIAESNTVLVDIGSRFCSACQKVKPVLETLRTQYGSNLKIIEIDLEESPQVIADLKEIKVFPTLLLYQNGKIILKKEGANDLKNNIDLALAKN